MRKIAFDKTGLGRLLADRSGLTNIEYGMILSLLAISSVGALDALGVSVRDEFTGSGEAVAANREAFFGGGSSSGGAQGTGGSGSNGSGTGGTGNGSSGGSGGDEGSTPDEPPVAAADMPVELPTEEEVDPVAPYEPPMAAMKASPGS